MDGMMVGTHGKILHKAVGDPKPYEPKPFDPATATWGDMLTDLVARLLKQPGAIYAYTPVVAGDGAGGPVPGTTRHVITIVADLPNGAS